MAADKRFTEGLELFKRHEFFECHEVIESLWFETDTHDKHRDLYKGVIQAAAALYQRDRGIMSGAKSLFETSVKYLEKYRPEALGLDIDKFIENLKVSFRANEQSE